MVTHVTEISTPPTPADPPTEFEQKAAKVWSELHQAIPQMNQQADDIEQIGADAQAAAGRAIQEADAALGYCNEAGAARDSALPAAAAAAENAGQAVAAKVQAEQARDAAQAAAASAVNRVAKTSDTGAALLPEGTTAQRPKYPSEIPGVGLLFRGNTTSGRPEFLNRGAATWEAIGTAAALTATTGKTEGTTGQALRVDDFGLGRAAASMGTYNLSEEQLFTGFQFEPASAAPGSPADGDGSSVAVNMCAPGGAYALQIGGALGRSVLKFRNKVDGVWGLWRTLWHDGNLSPAAIFGLNQTQKDVTSSRLPGVVYTNPSPRPIVLQVTGQSSAPGTQIELLLSGSWVWLAIQGSVTGQTSTTVIPAGVSYRLQATPIRVMEFS